MPPTRLSYKNQLKEMGINVNMSDGGNSFGGSDGLANVSVGYDDDDYDMNIEHLESEEEDILEQDSFKGQNLSQVAMVKRRDMTDVQRRRWLNDDGNGGRYKLAKKQEFDREEVRQTYNERATRTKKILD